MIFAIQGVFYPDSCLRSGRRILGASQLAATLLENVILEGKSEQRVETCGIQARPRSMEKCYDDPGCLRRGWAPGSCMSLVLGRDGHQEGGPW